MQPPPGVVDGPPRLGDDSLPSDHGESLTQQINRALSPAVSKSNSTISRQFSVRSHESVRVTGTIPLGELRIHDRPDPDAIRSIAEETTEQPVPSACLAGGDIFNLLELPAGFIVGHDSIAITTNERFKGFRDIPPGAHFLWVQPHTLSLRCGYWYISRSPGVLRVKQWDKFNGMLGDAASQAEVRIVESKIGSIYPSLIPYRLNGTGTLILTKAEPAFVTDPVAQWEQLTDAISAPFLDQITGKKHAAEWLVETADGIKGDTSTPITTSDAYRKIVGSELQFRFFQGCQERRILDYNSGNTSLTDTTTRVLALIDSDRSVSEQDMVAELQFAFVTGSHLGNVTCLEQWWELVLKVILRAYKLVLHRPLLCRRLLQTLHAQLAYTENKVAALQGGEPTTRADGPSGDRLLFDARSNSKKFLYGALAGYKGYLNSSLLELRDRITPEQKGAGQAFNDLEAWLWKCGWDLRRTDGHRMPLGDDDDDDDDLPVIVDVDENGREVGLVSFHRD